MSYISEHSLTRSLGICNTFMDSIIDYQPLWQLDCSDNVLFGASNIFAQLKLQLKSLLDLNLTVVILLCTFVEADIDHGYRPGECNMSSVMWSPIWIPTIVVIEPKLTPSSHYC